MSASTCCTSTRAAAYTVATHTVAWTEAATGVDPDLSVTELLIERTASADSVNDWLWTMAAPRTGLTVTFPVLPTDIYDYNAGATDTTDLEGLDEYKVPGGYNAIRPYVFSNIDPTTLLGTSGTASHEGILEEEADRLRTRTWFAPASHVSTKR